MRSHFANLHLTVEEEYFDGAHQQFLSKISGKKTADADQARTPLKTAVRSRAGQQCLSNFVERLSGLWAEKTCSPKKAKQSASRAETTDKKRKNSSQDHTPSTHNNSQSEGQNLQKNIPSLLSYREIQFMTTGDKIHYHLDALELILIFIEEIRCEGEQELWRELRLLLLQKYCCERKKIEKFMKKYPIETPFRLQQAFIGTEQIVGYMKLTTGKFKLKLLASQNMEVETRLKKQEAQVVGICARGSTACDRCLYKKLWEYIVCLSVDIGLNPEVNSLKISQALQIGFTIAELAGNQVVNLEERETAVNSSTLENFIVKKKEIFVRKLLG